MTTGHQTSQLLSKTIDLVRNRPRTVTYQVIADKTGLPVQFLQDLMAGRLKDPGVTRIECLYNYFAKEKLQKPLNELLADAA